jgi:hypothetical protein
VEINIIQIYDQIFCDLVAETYITGNSFFPTEKTLRPIIAKTPFIVLGPKGFLQNLKKLGFLTFSDWWDEEYDNFSGIERIRMIQNTVNSIMQWDDYKLAQVLKEMQPTLNNNLNTYMEYKYVKK